MVENLSVSRFRNGDPVPEAKTNEEWARAGKGGTPAWCYYDNDPENGRKYGKLYNWYAVNDSRGLAPKGWHIPTSAEIHVLATALNGNWNALKAVGQGAKDGAGTNASGFAALLGGYRYTSGQSLDLGRSASFWKSTEVNATSGRALELKSDELNSSDTSPSKAYGCSVRCLKGDTIDNTDQIKSSNNSEEAKLLGTWQDTKYRQPNKFTITKVGNKFQISGSNDYGVKNGPYVLSKEGTLVGMGVTLTYDEVNQELINTGNGYDSLHYIRVAK